MDAERRLRQLTADFPGTTPPDPESLADVVRRGKRAALLHRAGVIGGVAAAVVAAALVVPNAIDRPTPPVIDQPPAVEQDERLLPAPEPTPTEDHDGGVDPEVVDALPPIEDVEPSPDEQPAETSQDPTTTPREVVVTAEPQPETTTDPQPEPEPEVTSEEPAPDAEPTGQATSEPEPGPTTLAPYEGFTVSVSTTQAAYAEGSEPGIVVEACNATDQVREQRHAQTGHRYDLWIKHADSGEWVADTTQRTYPQTVEYLRWEPGQCRQWTETWDGTYGQIGETGGQGVPGGDYLVKAKWMGTEGETFLDHRWSPTFHLAGSSEPVAFEGFTVTLTTDKASYAYDEKVTFKIRACNTSGEAREQVIPHEGHWFDLYVKNADGQVVADTTWRTYDGAATVVSFPANACETFLETWWQCVDQVHSEPTGERVPAGTYSAKIHWLGTEQGQEYGWVASAPFELTG